MKLLVFSDRHLVVHNCNNIKCSTSILDRTLTRRVARKFQVEDAHIILLRFWIYEIFWSQINVKVACSCMPILLHQAPSDRHSCQPFCDLVRLPTGWPLLYGKVFHKCILFWICSYGGWEWCFHWCPGKRSKHFRKVAFLSKYHITSVNLIVTCWIYRQLGGGISKMLILSF